MKITGASLQMASSHASSSRHEVNESLRMWAARSARTPAVRHLVRVALTAKSHSRTREKPKPPGTTRMLRSMPIQG